MANWCFNSVSFYAAEAVIQKMEELFHELAIKEVETKHGQFPDFVTADNGWMHNISMEAGVLNYETKWCTNVLVIKQVADHFHCDFHLTYHEPGMLIYGEVFYETGVMRARWLESSDFDLFEMKEDDTYFFEGEIYESEYDILETLLERKEEIEVTGDI